MPDASEVRWNISGILAVEIERSRSFLRDSMMSGKEQARKLADEALDTAAEGDVARARELAEKAKKADPNAAQSVSDEADAEREQAATYQKREKQ